MENYRTVRHYNVSFDELKEKLGIPKNQKVIEIDDRSNDMRISTEELIIDSLEGK